MIRFYLIFTLFTLSAVAQTKTVNKTISNNALTENLVLPTGRSITINAGASIINNGTATGFGSGDWSTITGIPSAISSWAAITRASGFDTFTATPSSANLAAAVTNETGSGALVFATNPTLTTPNAAQYFGIPNGGSAGRLEMNGGLTSGGSGSILTSGNGSFSGGNINTSASSSLDGGSILTNSGGGSIDTRGTGSIQFGVSGTRTTLVGSATGSNKTITMPNVTGTLITTGDTGTIAAAMLANGSVTMAKINQASATTGQAIVWNGSAWAPATVAGSGATLAANTFTGLQQFSGTTHAGLQLNNLTTVQRDAIASPAAGMAIWNTTANRLQLHNGSGWTAGMVRIDGDTMTGALINSTNGALSAPSFTLTGSIITGGTATTTKPLALIEPTGATSTGWSTSGTALGVNAASGFTGRLLDAQVNGSSKGHFTHDGRVVLSADTFNNFSTPIVQTGSGRGLCSTGGSNLNLAAGGADCLGVSPMSIAAGSSHSLGFTSTTAPGANSPDAFFTRAAAASIQLGANTATNGATAIAQTLRAPNATGTTSTGGSLTIEGGTGTSAGGAVIIRTSTTTTPSARMTIKASGVINVSGIPTSSAGLVTGDLWSDGGTIKVIP
jgi:hypothetical protein